MPVDIHWLIDVQAGIQFIDAWGEDQRAVGRQSINRSLQRD
jgi:hypothetical protein